MTCGIGNLSKPKWQTDLIESWPPNAQSIMDQLKELGALGATIECNQCA